MPGVAGAVLLTLIGTFSTATADEHQSSELAAVEMLNAAYSDYDPKNSSSPVGVFLHVFEATASDPWVAKCDSLCLFQHTSQCRVSTTILNKMNGFLQDDWKYKQGMCKAIPDFCDVVIGIWPGLYDGKSPPAEEYYSTPGIVYFPDVAEQSLKCGYPFDSSSDMRPNRGCGCSVDAANCAPDSPNWPCPNVLNACSDRDPISKGHKITENSTVITACQCASMGLTEDVNPIYKGRGETVKCLWKGPQFFDGHGENELRRTLKQQYNFRKLSNLPWNEIVLDGQAMNGKISSNPAHAIAAFFYPLSVGCNASQCYKGAYAARDSYAKKFGVQVPVVGLNITNGEVPFQVVNSMMLDLETLPAITV